MSDMPEATKRPEWACLLHHAPASGCSFSRADEGYRTCAHCLDRLRADLQDVSRRFLLLDPSPGASGDHGSRGAPGFGSRPAASPHIITMTDLRSKSCEIAADATVYVWDPLADTTLEAGEFGPPAGAYVDKREVWYGRDGRAHTEQERPPRSVPAALASWAGLVAEERDITTAVSTDVHDLCRWLDQHLDWITRQDLAPDFATEIRELVAQLKPVTGEPGRRHIGLCPNVIDEGVHSRECGAKLYAPLRGDSIECRACDRVWEADEWLRLGQLLRAS